MPWFLGRSTPQLVDDNIVVSSTVRVLVLNKTSSGSQHGFNVVFVRILSRLGGELASGFRAPGVGSTFAFGFQDAACKWG